MCEFCNALKEGKEIEWYQRTTSTLDNSCENTNCDECDGCKHRFTIKGIAGAKSLYVRLSYFQSVGNEDDSTVIDSISESMLWCYCPVCGNQLSKGEHVDEKLPYPLEIIGE